MGLHLFFCLQPTGINLVTGIWLLYLVLHIGEKAEISLNIEERRIK